MTDKNEDWKQLCELVANESDPQRLSKYLDRLIRALDARKQAVDESLKKGGSSPTFPEEEK